ncbi:MAG: NFACT RNA binding domain-containing protein [archaeon]|nr:NFACT RNA binding domain-containing protein [archaeon]
MEFKEYKKYRWFFTSSGKLVIGGKSAEQNDSLLSRLKKSKEDYIIMHTSSPGSPFSVILSSIKNLKESDIEECAIFTGCFSRAWKEGKKSAIIDIFKLSEVAKEKSMKSGTWGVIGKIKHRKVELKLVLAKQKDILRAIPEIAIKDKREILLKIMPGKISKEDMLSKLKLEIEGNFSNEEILSALPAGGVAISK